MTSLRCFVYGVTLDPARLSGCAPDAVLDRIAHLPAHRLAFSPAGAPVVVGDEGHTVWGGIFEITEDQLDALASEEYDGSGVRVDATAVDREGERIPVVVYSAQDGGEADDEVVAHMIAGARHWQLPAGWIVGLEELVDPFEF